jgi:hypothetical protein
MDKETELAPVVNVEVEETIVEKDEVVIDVSNVETSGDEIVEDKKPEVETAESLNLVDELLSILLEKLNENGVDLNAANMSDIVRYGMEVVEISTAPKEERKQLVLDMVAKLVETSDIEENQKQACLHILEGDLLANLIELLIKASKGELQLNQETVEEVLEVTEDCCFAFLKFFKRK